MSALTEQTDPLDAPAPEPLMDEIAEKLFLLWPVLPVEVKRDILGHAYARWRLMVEGLSHKGSWEKGSWES